MIIKLCFLILSAVVFSNGLPYRKEPEVAEIEQMFFIDAMRGLVKELLKEQVDLDPTLASLFNRVGDVFQRDFDPNGSQIKHIKPIISIVKDLVKYFPATTDGDPNRK